MKQKTNKGYRRICGGIRPCTPAFLRSHIIAQIEESINRRFFGRPEKGKAEKRGEKEGSTVQESASKYKSISLGDGYYILYRQAENGLGGMKSTDITLCRTGYQILRRITDSAGTFLDQSGELPEKGVKRQLHQLFETMRYGAKISSFHNGLCCFGWEVQPDGRYWADEDGFGAEDDEELWLYALMDQTGRFVTEFSQEYDSEGYSDMHTLL